MNDNIDHIYLINNLSWLYFLNKQYSASLTYQPYEYVHDVLLDKLYNQETIDLADGIKGLTTYNIVDNKVFYQLSNSSIRYGSMEAVEA
jgi:hypothetical protein